MPARATGSARRRSTPPGSVPRDETRRARLARTACSAFTSSTCVVDADRVGERLLERQQLRQAVGTLGASAQLPAPPAASGRLPQLRDRDCDEPVGGSGRRVAISARGRLRCHRHSADDRLRDRGGCMRAASVTESTRGSWRASRFSRADRFLPRRRRRRWRRHHDHRHAQAGGCGGGGAGGANGARRPDERAFDARRIGKRHQRRRSM